MNKLLPREKAIKYGISSLTEVELLALILRSGTNNLNVIELAHNILEKVGGLANLENVSYEQLLQIKGIGKAKAIEIIALNSLYHKMNIVKVKNYNYANNPEMIFNLFKKEYSKIYQEHFIVLALDNKNAIIDKKVIFVGTLNYSIVHPREIFRFLIEQSALSFICLHNHPSNDVLPSKEDIDVTTNLLEISTIINIHLLDHIIIGKDKYFSFKENNYL
ncbi:MAG: DNA repair protein RadC [Bacilli bacterium]|jgi:DNA repair protein RadC|nr:DNA repair protein RadC [Bacilli bacterium]